MEYLFCFVLIAIVPALLTRMWLKTSIRFVYRSLFFHKNGLGDIKDLPSCHFEKATVESSGATRILFYYDDPDSVKIAQFLEALQKEYPMQCGEEVGCRMKYSTIFDDSQYANIKFDNQGFAIYYGHCWVSSDSLQKWVADSLYYDISSGEMLSFDCYACGPDGGWDVLLKLDKPMTEKDVSRLKNAVKGRSNREFTRIGDTCTVPKC